MSTTLGCIVMKCGTHINFPLRMKQPSCCAIINSHFLVCPILSYWYELCYGKSIEKLSFCLGQSLACAFVYRFFFIIFYLLLFLWQLILVHSPPSSSPSSISLLLSRLSSHKSLFDTFATLCLLGQNKVGKISTFGDSVREERGREGEKMERLMEGVRREQGSRIKEKS